MSADSLAECACGATYDDSGEFRSLPLDQVLNLDGATKFEVRSCECARLLGIKIDRDGNPLPVEQYC